MSLSTSARNFMSAENFASAFSMVRQKEVPEVTGFGDIACRQGRAALGASDALMAIALSEMTLE
eukprot:CAMPEP_0195054052 /NCGR_PEP_ID=MMETSP0448-20130528/3037_1 /TAXON_ID=66468 /ORGANISM="Heterocapsa triquestra, Strain CCMP 448" /LENGTH=63 /DNA_ID=CAMNT_0040083457 /DNA_START=40 /DNA_END=229 /DNA_ORIENTATION=-